jgi:hypothetical protein
MLAITPQLLQARHELEQLQRGLRRKESELRTRQLAGAQWQRDGQGWLRQAIEYGLLPAKTEIPKEWHPTLELLRAVLRAEPTAGEETIEAMDVALARLKELRAQETDLTAEHNISKERRVELQQLEDSTEAYADSLKIQRDRLSLSKWIRDLVVDRDNAIFEQSEEGRSRLANLCMALDATEMRLRSHPRAVESLGRETLRQREATKEILSKLKAVQKEIAAIEERSKIGKQIALRRERNARFLGGLEESVRLFETQEPSSDLSKEIAALKQSVIPMPSVLASRARTGWPATSLNIAAR